MAQAQSILEKAPKLDLLSGIASSLIASLMVCVTWFGPIYFSWFLLVHLILSVTLGAFAGYLGGKAMGRVGALIFGFFAGLFVSFLLSFALFLFLRD